MRFHQLLFSVFSASLLPSALSADFASAMTELGYTDMLSSMQQDANFVNTINSQNGLTIHVVSNSVLAGSGASRRRVLSLDQIRAMVSYPPPPNNRPPGTKRAETNSAKNPPSNYELIVSMLDNPIFANIRTSDCEYPQVRFVKNLAGPPSGDLRSPPITEVTTGSGKVVRSTKLPVKYDKGVILEIDGLFALPDTFRTTMSQLNNANRFLQSVISSNQLSFFENTPALTIFVPIDTSLKKCGNHKPNPQAHVIQGFLGYTTELIPFSEYRARSGNPIDVTYGGIGGRSVNGRNFVIANIPIRNGVIHFIDGPLDCPPQKSH